MFFLCITFLIIVQIFFKILRFLSSKRTVINQFKSKFNLEYLILAY